MTDPMKKMNYYSAYIIGYTSEISNRKLTRLSSPEQHAYALGLFQYIPSHLGKK